MKICANDSSTFIKNRGYHFEKEVKVSVLGREPVVGEAKDNGAMLGSHKLATCIACATTNVNQPPRS